ncbi:MAG: flagellar hook-length control protein FliK [Phycisphaerales bacterium]
MQIDAAVRVENATGQPATLQLAAPLPVPPSLPSGTTASLVQELPTPTTPTPSADPDHDPFTARILRGLSATLNQRGGVLTMRLEPPELGQLRIQMTITQGTVSAEFQAATPQAQALLERSLAVLRSALQGHGLTVERLTVHTAQQVNTQATRQDPPEQQTQQERQHADAGKGESRGRRDGDQTASFRRPMPRPTNEYAAFDVSPQPAGAD